FSYTGHFNLLNKFKKQHPDVKTLISVGGWAETGGYFGEDGTRVNSGGFYTMTTNADGSVNQAGIDAFAKSAVEFIETYGFDGVDIDYEYPSSMNDSGHPDDFPISNARRAGLNASYRVLMQKLREELDIAGEKAGKHYLLTIASPSSGYLLRGMETFQSVKYLDYVNIMSYDLHGAWNSHVGHNAALFDTGLDSELAQWGVYTTAEFEGIGYLNTDWAVRYFRGAVSAGRINIGIPYYTRGFKDVSGGTNGLWGQAALPDQSKCAKGTGVGEKNQCGNGALGIDNLWHDKNDVGEEMPAGSNPLWHAKNLENGINPSYLEIYGLTPETDADDVLTGTYTRFYDDVAVAPWLWNAEKKVFLSIEDEQ
ncbi:MAG TPA: glycoside hydrolase, partial [Pseudoalteromonas sp.]|nr:glycoside hydrolase [Pseudoalteromonas sp.]